jgi:hypothetical protein
MITSWYDYRSPPIFKDLVLKKAEKSYPQDKKKIKKNLLQVYASL